MTEAQEIMKPGFRSQAGMQKTFF